jgi:hypothetical protein
MTMCTKVKYKTSVPYSESIIWRHSGDFKSPSQLGDLEASEPDPVIQERGRQLRTILA